MGVGPSTAYLEGSGVELDRGSVVVDERFATNVPGIWAVGDIANFHDPVFGHRRLIQHWTNANHQGERLGRLLAGEDAPYDQVAFFFSEVFGTKIGLLGDLDGGHDELVMRGSLEDGALIGWYLRDGRLARGADLRAVSRDARGAQRAAAKGRARDRPRGPRRSRATTGRGVRRRRMSVEIRRAGPADAELFERVADDVVTAYKNDPARLPTAAPPRHRTRPPSRAPVPGARAPPPRLRLAPAGARTPRPAWP